MTEKPILFNAEMVRAILAGQKTQTRRVINLQPVGVLGAQMTRANDMDVFLWHGWPHMVKSGHAPVPLKCPYGEPGDLLWVRETWATDGVRDAIKPTNLPPDSHIYYRASLNEDKHEWQLHTNFGGRWRPSIHMPRWTNRIMLRIEVVRVERVAEIEPRDAIAEGVEFAERAWAQVPARNPRRPIDYVEAFRHLWDSINAKRGFGWDANPWVWVVEFSVKREDNKNGI